MSGVRSVSTVLWDMDRVPLEQLCEHHKIDQHHLKPFKDALLSHGYGKRFQAKEGPNGIPVGALVRYLLGKDQASLGEHVRATDSASQKESEDVVGHFSEYPELDELIKERVVRVRVMRMINQMIDRVVAGGEVLHSAAPTPHTQSMDATPVAGTCIGNASFPSEPKKVINTPVATWLAEHGMEKYAEAFHREGFDEMEDLKSVAFSPPSSPEQTIYQSIVHLLGHREKIKRLITATMHPTKEWVDRISNISPGDEPLGSTAPSENESHRPSPSPSAFVDSAIVAMSAAQRESSASPGGVFQALAAAAAGSSSGTPASGVDLSRFVNKAPSHTVRVNGRPYDRRLLVATRGLRNPQEEGLKFCTDDKCLRRHLQYVVPANRKDNPFEIQAVCTDAPQFVLECDNIHAGFVRVKFKGRYAVWSMRWVSEVTDGLQKQLGSAPQMPRNRIIVCEESTCTFKERCSSGHFEVTVDGTPRNILDFGSTTALQLVMQQQWVDKLTLVKPSELQRGADDRSSLATEEYLALLDGDEDDHRISLHQHANRRNTNMSGLPVMRPLAGDCLAGTCDNFHFFGLCGRGAGCPCIHLASPAKSKLARGVFLRLHYDPLMEHFQSGEHQQVATGNKLRSKNLQTALIDDVACLKDRMMRRRKFISVSEVGDVLVGTTCQVCRHAMFNLLKEVFNRSSCSLMGALCNRYGAIRTKKGGRIDGTDPDIEDLMWNVKRYLDDQREPSFEDDLAIHEPILLLNRAVVEAIQNHPPFPPRILAHGQQLHMQPEIPVYWDFENVLITDKEELQLFISSVKSLLCCEGIAFAESRVRIKAFGTQSVFNNVIDYVRDMQVEMVLCSDRKSEEVDRSIEKNIRETVLDGYRGSAYPAFVMITSDKDSIAIAEEGKAHGKQVFFIHDAPKGGNHERALMKASHGCYSLMDVYLSPFTKPEDRMIVGAGGGVARPQAPIAHHQPRHDPPYNAPAHQQQHQQHHQQHQRQALPSSTSSSQPERSVMSFFQGGPPTSSSNVPPPRGGVSEDNIAANMLREASGARAGAGSRVMNFGAKQQGATNTASSPPTPQKVPAAIPASEPKVGDLLAMAMKLQQSKPSIPAPKSQSNVKAVLTSKNQPKQPQQQAPAAPQQQQQQQHRHADPAPPATSSSSSTCVDMSDVLGVLDPHFMPKRSSVAYYLLLVDALVLRILDLQKRHEEGGKKDASLVRGPFKFTLPGRAKGQFDSKGSKIGGSTNLDPHTSNNGKFNHKSGKKREDAFDRLNAETFELEDEAVVSETKEQKAATSAYRALESEYHQNVQDEMRAELTRFFTSAKAVMPPWFTATPDKAIEKRCLGDLIKAPDTWLDMKEIVRKYPHAEAAAILRGKKRGLPPMVEMDTYRNALGVLRCIGNVVEGPIDGAPNLPTDLQRIVLHASE